MNPPSQPDPEDTNRLLRTIIALMLQPRDQQFLTLKQKVEFLSGLGLSIGEIAKILGRSYNHVNKEIVGIRKKQRKSKGNGKK